MRVTRTLRAVAGATLAGALLLASGGSAAADPARKYLWPLEAFDAQDIWKEATGKGVTVAVIDSGFRNSHQDLAGQFLPGKEFDIPSVDDNPALRERGGDIRDHGTGVASLIAGHGHGPGGSSGIKGLAPDAKLLPLVVDKDGPAATRYAVDQGADVINMSYVADKLTPDMCQSIHYAIEKGVVVVAGVGNDGWDEERFPAACPGVIGAGAVDMYGKAWGMSNYNSTVDVLAPGVKIPVATGKSDSSYGTSDGTSLATAYVSAAVALLKEKFPDYTPGQIANRLVKSAGLTASVKKQNLKLPDAHYGYGFIQPYGALTRDIPPGPPEGPLPMPKGKASATAVRPGAEKGPDPDPPMDGRQKLLVFGGGAVGLLAVAGIAATVVAVIRHRRKNAASHGWS
ncbi:S8 family serine peptidase [Streptomyces sp. NPDC003077]|uniref:S8 family serine peptidase n=1 Tax=Streptomyces sp. NPDC003077 TaxID=3154443 RepID=UPI0033A73472